MFDIIVDLCSKVSFKYYYDWNVEKFCLKDQLLMTFIKLRLNLAYPDSAFRFKTSESTYLHKIKIKIAYQNIVLKFHAIFINLFWIKSSHIKWLLMVLLLMPVNCIWDPLLVKKIVGHCGVLNILQPGDLVLADKGFLISDLMPPETSLNIPPFLMSPQFTPSEVLKTKSIARARIHVERVMVRLKKFKILTYKLIKIYNFLE
ncbi:THAP-type domain-containing protein [Aphis craccivora]|uniref:THAP-type domain-containing protein n=1 Tax=Aphis craccivora TaxID=307492 RepID=A0A6G0YF16_APHCR|nr:THAP-type domain-containing protein [Aphis craccivora]